MTLNLFCCIFNDKQIYQFCIIPKICFIQICYLIQLLAMLEKICAFSILYAERCGNDLICLTSNETFNSILLLLLAAYLFLFLLNNRVHFFGLNFKFDCSNIRDALRMSSKYTRCIFPEQAISMLVFKCV